jgi:hypothetical protein
MARCQWIISIFLAIWETEARWTPISKKSKQNELEVEVWLKSGTKNTCFAQA